MKALLLAALLSVALPAIPAFAADTPAACPKAAEQLPELLATAMQQRMLEEGDVRVEYEVSADGRLLPLKIDGHRQYRTPVRIALRSVDCHAGQAQRYVMNVRFAKPGSTAAATALAAVDTQAASAPSR